MATFTRPKALRKTPARRTTVQRLSAALTTGTSAVRRRYMAKPLWRWTACPASWHATATEATEEPPKLASERWSFSSRGSK